MPKLTKLTRLTAKAVASMDDDDLDRAMSLMGLVIATILTLKGIVPKEELMDALDSVEFNVNLCIAERQRREAKTEPINEEEFVAALEKAGLVMHK